MVDKKNIQQKELELFNRYQQGDREAKRELLKSLNPVINQQVNKFATSGLPVVAIKLEGQKLTSNAIDTYDPNRSQLNTHVINNLKKLSRFVTNYQNVGHIPEPRALMIGKYNNIYSHLKEDLNRDPNTLELSEAMKIPMSEVERLQTELRGDLSTGVISNDEDDIGFYEFKKQEEIDPKTKEAIDFVYFDSDSIDKKILEYTLGLYGHPRKKAKEIAMSLNLSDSELKKRKLNLAKEIKGLTR